MSDSTDAGAVAAASGWTTWLTMARIYGWLVIGGAAYGILAAHVPFLIGHPWTTCRELGADCVLTFHLFEVPVVLLIGGMGVFAVRYLDWTNRKQFLVLLMAAIAAMLVFLLFETILLLRNFETHAPDWESWALVSIALVLLTGASLGIWVAMGLVDHLSGSASPD